MTESLSVSSESPRYAREILLHLRHFETTLDEILNEIATTAAEYDTTLSSLNDRLVALIMATNKPPVSPEAMAADSMSISDSDVLAIITEIYTSVSSDGFETDLSDLDSDEPTVDKRIPLVTGNNNLHNWVTVLEFVTNRLDNLILSKLRELYAVIESVDVETKNLLLDEVSNLISAIIDTCENNRKVMLHLNDLNNKLIIPEIVEGIEQTHEKLHGSTFKNKY